MSTKTLHGSPICGQIAASGAICTLEHLHEEPCAGICASCGADRGVEARGSCPECAFYLRLTADLYQDPAFRLGSAAA